MTGTNDFYHRFRLDCERWVREGAAILRRSQRNQTVVRMKDDVDLATSADIAAESYYIRAIRRKYPDHGIYSEEAGEVTEVRDNVWIIDPLDGTKEFARGADEYNTLLAIEHLGKLVACGMFRNGVNALYSAAFGEGSYKNGKGMEVSHTTDMLKAFIGFHVPTRFNPEEHIDRSLGVLEEFVKSSYRVRPGWDDSRYAAWVAQGLLDAHVVSANVNRWYDVAPGILLVTEAGGKVTDWEGQPLKNHNLSHGIIFSNGHLHDELLEGIRKSS